MNKKTIFLVAGILLLGITACQDNTKPVESKVTLSAQEKELANGDANVGAQLLVRKAVLKEINDAKLDEKEKFELQFVKDEAAIAYYLQKTIGNTIKVTDEEVEKVYNDNKDKFKGQKLEELRDRLKGLIARQEQNQKLVDYYNSLVNKYKLNDSLKADFPEKKDEVKK